MKIVKLFVSVVVVAGLAFAACGGGESIAASNPATAGGSFDWPTSGPAGGGGNLVIVSNAEIKSIEPGEAGTAGHAYPVLRNVIQSLLTRNTKTNQIEPLLATEWTAVDALHWRFKLREGVTWHDGTPLTAENAALSLSYIWDQKIPYAGNFVDGPVKFSAIDRYTLGMELTKPDSLVPAKMTVMPLASPVQIKNAPDTLPRQLIGTGPYKFVSFTPGLEIKLALNKDYFDLHPGMFDTVSWIFRAESQVRAQLVQTGEADIAIEVTPEQCQANAKNGAKCVQATSIGFRFLRPDQYNQTVLADPRIRKAIAYAVDRPGIADAFISKPAQVIDNPGPIGMVGSATGIATYKYDVGAAKKLVAEAKAAGINTNLPLTVKYRIGFYANIADIAQAVVTNLNAIGLNAKVEAIADAPGLAQYRQNFEGNTIEKITKDRGWIFLATTSNELFDFAQLGDTLLACKGKFSVYCNPDAEKAYETAKTLVGDARQKAFADLWTRLYRSDVPLLPIAQQKNQYVISGRTQIQPRSDGVLPLAEARAAKLK